jgi:hypothetical protein
MRRGLGDKKGKEAVGVLGALTPATGGVTIVSNTLGGHRDYASTACPGANLYSHLASGELWHNCDDSDWTLARGVLDDRYTWLEEGILDPSIEGPWIAQNGGVAKPDVHRFIRD